MASNWCARFVATVLSLSYILSAHAQSSGFWQTLAPLPTARQELATAVLNGKIYVIAGYDVDGRSTALVEVYDPVTNTWTSAHRIPFVANHNAAAVAADKLYSLNGNTMHVYDPEMDAWTQVATANSPHGQTPAVGVFEEKIYVAGGLAATSSRALEVYDPAANTWTVRASMSVARNHTGGAFINGKFYVVGGRGSTGAPTALEVYDPQSNTWRSLAPMPTGRSGIAAAALNGELFVFGGEIPNLHGEVEAYNPATNTWRRLPDMPNPRHGIWASVIGNRVYLAGGGDQQGFGASDVNDVFTVDRAATFANISSRLKVERGDNVLIGGFIVAGTASKRIIVRAPGPSLRVAGALADPVLELYNGAGQLVATNDNWRDAPNKQEIIDSGLAPTQDSEPAILTRVAPDNHTAIVRGSNSTTGVGLVEVYDLEDGSESKLANISTRGFVQSGDNVLIGGLILSGSFPRRVIVRALGPSLPLAGTLPNPNLTLHDANGALLAANDDWRTEQESEIAASHLAPANDLESAILRTLLPGNYTAVVRGAPGTTGVALVEAYTLD